MNICVAGKNNIAIDVCQFVVEHYSCANIFAVVNKTDKGNDGWQKSFLKYVQQTPRVQLVTLEDLYNVPNLVFISVEYDCIIKPSLFKTEQLYNVHFSMLPKYKGVYTSVWPILNGDKYSGVTLHKIDRGIDTGDIIAQRRITISRKETSYSLYHKFIKYGTMLVIKYIDKLIRGNVVSFPQESFGSTYYSRRSIDYMNLQIDLNCTAAQIDKQIRAFYFPAYQIPQVYDRNIIGTQITKHRSVKCPGMVLLETEDLIRLSTIDYDIILRKL